MLQEDDAPRSGVRGRALRVFTTRHLLAIVVLVIVSGISIATSIVLHGVVRSQERRLLNERATEVAAYLKATTAQTSTTLLAAGEAVATDGAPSRLFHTLSAPLAQGGATIAVAQEAGGRFGTVIAAGSRAAVGTALRATQAKLVRRAAGANGLVFAFSTEADGNHLTEAIGVPGAAEPTVAFMETVLPPPTPVTPTADSPYRELNAVLYAGTTADPKRIVLIYGSIPKSSSHPARALVTAGSDSALLVISARGALVGGFASAVPWIVLAGGLVLALLLFLLVEVLSRRRSYALNLVAQRTRDMYRAQMAAEAANRSKSEFLSRMSHELRTPLNAVLGFSQLLELDELTAEQEQAVGQITHGGRHLLELINEILDISRIETGTLTMSPEAVNVGELVVETVELVQPLAAERGVHLLGIDMESCDVYLFADRQRLKQILLNLLGNAIKYNRDGGTVSITCAASAPARVRIEVTDTGPGIPEQQHELLFTPFERLGAEQTTVEGTGIGLALSRRLAEAMGGTIGVESTLGRGSTFWVEFAIAEGPLQRVERLDELGGTTVIDTVDLDRPLVLHIEDNLSNTKLVERVLAQRPGVKLIAAMQGRLGLQLARQHRPALILLDLNLADVSGEEVLHLLRDDPATAPIPVVIVSADAMPRQMQRLLAMGATAYLTKPIDVRQLLELVDRSLDARTRRTPPVGAGVADEGRD